MSLSQALNQFAQNLGRYQRRAVFLKSIARVIGPFAASNYGG